MNCPACGTGTNSSGQPLLSYQAVTLHVAGKILGGDRTHRTWVKDSAPNLELAAWCRKSLNWNNMNALAELIYPTVELTLDQAYEAENKIEEKPADVPSPRTVTASYVANMARVLNRILDAIDPESKPGGESVTARINRLNWSGLLPRHVAALMRVIREYRNPGEHERMEFSDADVQAIQGAWKVIHEWATAQGIKLETFGDL